MLLKGQLQAPNGAGPWGKDIKIQSSLKTKGITPTPSGHCEQVEIVMTDSGAGAGGSCAS